MVRGMNTEFVFALPYYFNSIESMTIEFWQERNDGLPYGHTLPIFKTKDDCKIRSNPKEMSVVLNDAETIRFVDDRKAYVRVSGVAIVYVWGKPQKQEFSSDKFEITVHPTSDDSLLEEDILPAPDYHGWKYIKLHEGE